MPPLISMQPICSNNIATTTHRDSTPEGWAVLISREENSFHNARIRFSVRHIGWGKIESELLLLRKCRHHLISRDLFGIKIVVWNYLQTDSVIILAIRFAVFVNCISIEHVEITIQLNSSIGCFWWSPNSRLKPKQPRTTWHHNAAGTSQVALWRHECDA